MGCEQMLGSEAKAAACSWLINWVAVCEQLWPVLTEMFSPWLTPYWTSNLKEPAAAWIQQLTDDRSVLLPWIAADGPHAHSVMCMFTECVRFILGTLPGNVVCLQSVCDSSWALYQVMWYVYRVCAIHPGHFTR